MWTMIIATKLKRYNFMYVRRFIIVFVNSSSAFYIQSLGHGRLTRSLC